jgi:hypothetical protein
VQHGLARDCTRFGNGDGLGQGRVADKPQTIHSVLDIERPMILCEAPDTLNVSLGESDRHAG